MSGDPNDPFAGDPFGAPPPPREPSPFGEIDETRQAYDSARGRAAERDMDRALAQERRKKRRMGWPLVVVTVLFAMFVVIPVAWVLLYRFVDPPGTFLMLSRSGGGAAVVYRPVRLADMSPHAVRSVIAAEDANFCTHDGFDFEAIRRAMESNRQGGRLRGASTISQQTAKNLFLWEQRSWVRKAFEAYFTFLIEKLWPKQRIMEAYLNVAEFGDGVFGIEAAAQARFGVSAAELTPLQAARLAAVLPSPNRYSATRPGPYVRRQSASIMARARVVRNEGYDDCVYPD